MPPQKNDVIQLTIAKCLYEDDNPYEERLVASCWRGILQVAQSLFNTALEAPRKQTSRPLLDPQKTVTIRFV